MLFWHILDYVSIPSAMIEKRAKTIHDARYLVLIEFLRASRETANVTQADLAMRLETDQSYISKYERAERRLDVIELRAVCHALGLDFQHFLASFEQELKRRNLA